MNFKNIKGFFFDLDGTLIDSKLDFLAMRKDLGISLDIDILEYVESLEDNELKNKANAIIHHHEIQGAKNSVMIEGVTEFISYLISNDLPFGILTRNSKLCSLEMFKMHGLKIEHLITREDAPPKPRPDGLNILKDRFNLEPHQCIYVGDYIHDLKSAQNAGMIPVLFENSQNSHFKEHAEYHFNCYKTFLNKIKSDIEH